MDYRQDYIRTTEEEKCITYSRYQTSYYVCLSQEYLRRRDSREKLPQFVVKHDLDIIVSPASHLPIKLFKSISKVSHVKLVVFNKLRNVFQYWKQSLWHFDARIVRVTHTRIHLYLYWKQRVGQTTECKNWDWKYQIFGVSKTGKSYLCHTLSVFCQMPIHSKGAAGKAIYIDTKEAFRPTRLLDIAPRFGIIRESVRTTLTTWLHIILSNRLPFLIKQISWWLRVDMH